MSTPERQAACAAFNAAAAAFQQTPEGVHGVPSPAPAAPASTASSLRLLGNATAPPDSNDPLIAFLSDKLLDDVNLPAEKRQKLMGLLSAMQQ